MLTLVYHGHLWRGYCWLIRLRCCFLHVFLSLGCLWVSYLVIYWHALLFSSFPIYSKVRRGGTLCYYGRWSVDVMSGGVFFVWILMWGDRWYGGLLILLVVSSVDYVLALFFNYWTQHLYHSTWQNNTLKHQCTIYLLPYSLVISFHLIYIINAQL
jgi:hypothetical protein